MEIEQWPAAAVATVVAALVTASFATAAAVASGVWAVRRWRADDRHRRRDQYWDRLAWSLDLAASTDPVRAEIGLSLLEGVYDMPWITTEDQALNTIVMQVLAAEEDPG
jgi:hypothetical protein